METQHSVSTLSYQDCLLFDNGLKISKDPTMVVTVSGHHMLNTIKTTTNVMITLVCNCRSYTTSMLKMDILLQDQVGADSSYGEHDSVNIRSSKLLPD